LPVAPVSKIMASASASGTRIITERRRGNLFGVRDYGDLTDEGVFHGGAQEKVGDVWARG
jgi:hypothetical protein